MQEINEKNARKQQLQHEKELRRAREKEIKAKLEEEMRAKKAAIME